MVFVNRATSGLRGSHGKGSDPEDLNSYVDNPPYDGRIGRYKEQTTPAESRLFLNRYNLTHGALLN